MLLHFLLVNKRLMTLIDVTFFQSIHSFLSRHIMYVAVTTISSSVCIFLFLSPDAAHTCCLLSQVVCPFVTFVNLSKPVTIFLNLGVSFFKILQVC